MMGAFRIVPRLLQMFWVDKHPKGTNTGFQTAVTGRCKLMELPAARSGVSAKHGACGQSKLSPQIQKVCATYSLARARVWAGGRPVLERS